MNVHRVSSSKWSINVCLISCSKVSNSVSGGVSMITRVWNCDTKSSLCSHFLRRNRFRDDGLLRRTLVPPVKVRHWPLIFQRQSVHLSKLNFEWSQRHLDPVSRRCLSVKSSVACRRSVLHPTTERWLSFVSSETDLLTPFLCFALTNKNVH